VDAKVIMKPEARKLRVSLTWWISTSVLGGVVGFLLALPIVFFIFLAHRYSQSTGESSMEAGILFAFMGVGIGSAQMLYLRRQLKVSSWWWFGYALGSALVGAILGGEYPSCTRCRHPLPPFIDPAVLSAGVVRLLAVVLGGAVVGVIQWLVLRRQLKYAHWWPLATIVAFIVQLIPVPVAANAAGAAVSQHVAPALGALLGLAIIVIGLIGVFGVTGALLIRLLQHPVPQES
jgi:hypothetical protein